MSVLLLICVLLLPWVLGFFIVKALLKQRCGYRLLSVGAGNIVGWLSVYAIMSLYEAAERPYSVIEFVGIQLVILLPFVFLRAKPCSIQELSLRNAQRNSIYVICLILQIVLVYRFSLIGLDMLTNQGLLDESVLQAQQGAFDFFNAFNANEIISGKQLSMTEKIQVYIAITWGDWNANVVRLPWLGVGIAMFFSMFGGLRYLNVQLFPSMLAAYAVVSVPLWDAHVSLSNSIVPWVSVALLLSCLFLIISLALQERKVMLGLFVFVLSIYCFEVNALIFLLPFGVILVWYVFGGFISLVVLIIAAFFLKELVGVNWIARPLQMLLYSLGSNGEADDANVISFLKTDTIHYVLMATLGSILLLLKRQKVVPQTGYALLIVAGCAYFILSVLVGFYLFDSRNVNVNMLSNFMVYNMPILFLSVVGIYSRSSR